MKNETLLENETTVSEVNNHNRGSIPGKDSDEWRTPLTVIRAIERHFGIQFVADMAATPDNALCSVYFTKEENTPSLSAKYVLDKISTFLPAPDPGIHALWCNPPYGSTGLECWIDHARHISAGTGLPYVLIVPASRCEQDWFYLRAAYEYHVGFMRRRVPFLRPDGTPGKAPNHPSFVLGFPGQCPTIVPEKFSHIQWKRS
jgi:phage N-6-adenine-methyltransferase